MSSDRRRKLEVISAPFSSSPLTAGLCYMTSHRVEGGKVLGWKK